VRKPAFGGKVRLIVSECLVEAGLPREEAGFVGPDELQAGIVEAVVKPVAGQRILFIPLLPDREEIAIIADHDVRHGNPNWRHETSIGLFENILEDGVRDVAW